MARVLPARIAIVTGAGNGIGRAIAVALATDGIAVSLWGRSASSLADTAKMIGTTGADSVAVAVDISDDRAVLAATEQTLERFDRIDVLVNNAGINHPDTALLQLDPEVWRHVIDVNLTGFFYCIRNVVPHMVRAGTGKVINVASTGGRKGAAGRGAYRATKAALINLTETLAAETHRQGISVTCVCPGGTNTPMGRLGEQSHREFANQEEDELIQPEDIAEVVRFLASDASRAITGTSIDAWGPTNPLFKS